MGRGLQRVRSALSSGARPPAAEQLPEEPLPDLSEPGVPEGGGSALLTLPGLLTHL